MLLCSSKVCTVSYNVLVTSQKLLFAWLFEQPVAHALLSLCIDSYKWQTISTEDEKLC